MLPAGYSTGTVTQQLTGWGVSTILTLQNRFRGTMSQVFKRTKSGKFTNAKDHTDISVVDDETKPNLPHSEEGSPKISAIVAQGKKHNAAFVL